MKYWGAYYFSLFDSKEENSTQRKRGGVFLSQASKRFALRTGEKTYGRKFPLLGKC